MTKETYLAILGERLRPHLSEEEYQDVMQYYSEYFDEAGPKKEEETAKELGTPEALAERILGESRSTGAPQGTGEPQETGIQRETGGSQEAASGEAAGPQETGEQQTGSKKKWKLSLGWTIAIGVIAALIVLIVAAAVMAIVFIILCVVLFFAGIWLLFHAFANGLVTIGAALLLGGVGILLLTAFAGIYRLLKKGYQAIRERRRNKNEENV